MRKDFAVFILTHGRADNVRSYNALKLGGYTGKIYLLVDNLDPQLKQYQQKYGDEVCVFDKMEAVKITDACDNYQRHNSVVFARNYNFIVAKKLGIKYFWQLDDDYNRFGYGTDNKRNYVTSDIYTTKLDDLLTAMIELLKGTGAKSIAIAQGGDYIGGAESTMIKLAKQEMFSRKVMNSFLFDVDKVCTFRGRVNDDVNLYVESGRKGDLFITIPRLRLWQELTQEHKGGCTEIYLELGTYIKSFYSVMVAPSCVKITKMGTKFQRIHHAVNWNCACPMIIDPKNRK